MTRRLAALFLVAVASCSRPAEPPVAEASLDWDPGGPVTIPAPIVRALQEPSRVTAYRVTNQFEDDWQQLQDRPKIGEYPRLAEAPVPPETAAAIAAILTDPATYMRENESMTCLFEPHHALRYETGSGAVDVIICFDCGDVEMKRGNVSFFHSLARNRAESRLHQLVESVLSTTRGNVASAGSPR